MDNVEIPEKELRYQLLFEQSSKIPLSIPETLRHPIKIEELIDKE